MNMERLERHARPAVKLLKALSNEHRLVILCELGMGECCVTDLAARVGLSQSALSQHLARLRADGLVATRRTAQTVHYRLASAEAVRLIDVLAGLYCPVPDTRKILEENRTKPEADD